MSENEKRLARDFEAAQNGSLTSAHILKKHEMDSYASSEAVVSYVVDVFFVSTDAQNSITMPLYICAVSCVWVCVDES